MSDPRRAQLEMTIAASDRAHRDLDVCIAGLSKVASAENEIDDLRGALESLKRALKQHFTHEESSPLYRWVPEAFPETQRLLEILQAQHGPTLEAIAALAELSGPDLRRKALELVIRLRSHESAEHAVLQRALQRLTDQER